MVGQDMVDPQVARALAAMEEVRAQYRADRERARADDEARLAEQERMAEEHRVQAEESAGRRAEEAEQGTTAAPVTSDHAKWAAVEEQDRARFLVEEETAPASPRPAARHRAPEPEDDDFSSTNWVDAE